MRGKRKILGSKYIISFIFKFSAVIFAASAVSGLLIVIFLNKDIGPTYLEGLSTLNRLQASLPIIILITVSIQALTLCAAAIILALLWSHNFAGPLMRFRKHLKDIALGKPLKEPLVFRNGDQLSGLSQSFTEMILAHKDYYAQALALLLEAQRIIDICASLKNQKKDGTSEFKSKFKELERIYTRIKDIYTAQKQV